MTTTAPEAALRPCSHPHCVGYAVGRSGRCAKHRIFNPGIVTPGLNPANKRFRRARHSFLIRHPLCARCKRAADVLDHIVPHRGSARLFWDQSNWQALCYHCHGIKTHDEVLADRGTAND